MWLERKAIEERTQTQGLSPLIVTETKRGETKNFNSINSKESISFPVKPVDKTVGEFKVLPETHAGYAVTWFGLSGAGVIMMRKMITRGR